MYSYHFTKTEKESLYETLKVVHEFANNAYEFIKFLILCKYTCIKYV